MGEGEEDESEAMGPEMIALPAAWHFPLPDAPHADITHLTGGMDRADSLLVAAALTVFSIRMGIRRKKEGRGKKRPFPGPKVRPSKVTVLCSVAAIYVPTFRKLFAYGWRFADYGQGPLVLAAFLWLLWRRKEVFSGPVDERAHPFFLALMACGLLMYLFGSAEKTLVIESISMIPVFIGAAGLLFGGGAARRILFPALYLLFLVPPPLFMIDMITSPMKKMATAASVLILRGIGYPAGRTGVLLRIGDYMLVVGRACSGMRSLVALMAVGALYAYLRKMPGLKRAFLLASVLPISIGANVARLVALALVTYYFGEAAGRGLLHEALGLFVFLAALACLFGLEEAMTRGKRTGYAR
ncbi:MAG: exosortase [Nitrospiraceae bacterium]|nr:exosortase [Nitrospiraceae bacterium]